MCRDILSSCVRNTEEAEKNSQTAGGNNAESGRGLGKGVWVMIEESELAKTIRLGEEKKVGVAEWSINLELTYVYRWSQTSLYRAEFVCLSSSIYLQASPFPRRPQAGSLIPFRLKRRDLFKSSKLPFKRQLIRFASRNYSR
jgi:hypothetical protein